MSRIFAPMAHSFGQLGEMVADTAARSIAEHDRHGFGNTLARFLEQRRE
ncbi:MAG: hypothetical protein M3Y21_11990 [Candidatus Eremiobacteraeota bacterium]|nr:hypothetical protein [Candidatus Eremiobacteraeota bacterium]